MQAIWKVAEGKDVCFLREKLKLLNMIHEGKKDSIFDLFKDLNSYSR